jgi:hypothetical protein
MKNCPRCNVKLYQHSKTFCYCRNDDCELESMWGSNYIYSYRFIYQKYVLYISNQYSSIFKRKEDTDLDYDHLIREIDFRLPLDLTEDKIEKLLLLS